MKWQKVKLQTILTESKVESIKPNADKRITVRLNLKGVTKRPLKNDMKGATKYYKRSFNQFIYGKQNFFKGAFGIIPKELDGYDTSSDLPCFDIDTTKCKPEWVMFFLKQGNYYKVLEKLARGAGSKRISPKDFLQLDIPLPPLTQQEIILNRLFILESKGNSLTCEITHQQTLLKKLRQSILQEAIEGKLTASWREQNPDVESASVLLEKIKKEKEQLIKEKKIKKQKPLPPINEDEIPFDIPDGWEWCRLGDIINIKSGKRIHVSDYKEKGIPFLRSGEIGSLGRGEKPKNELFISEKKYYEIKEKFGIPKSGDILIACIGGSIGNTWIVDDREFYYKDGNLVLLESIKEVDTKFLQSFLTSPFFWNHTILNATDSSYNALTIVKLNFSLFQLPPLEEQKEIVKKIESLFKICDELETQINSSKVNSEMLMQAVLKEAFEG